MIKELYGESKEEFVMDKFRENVKTNDFIDNPVQPKNRKVSKKKEKNQTETKAFQYFLEYY